LNGKNSLFINCSFKKWNLIGYWSFLELKYKPKKSKNLRVNMAKATSYTFQGREWTVKDLAEELGLSTPRVHGLLKEHNEDIKAIFESRGITPKPADKGPKARLFDYKGKQWTVKQLAEEFGLSNVRVNRLIKEHDGDIEKIVLSKEKSKKTTETKKAPKTEKTDEKRRLQLMRKKLILFVIQKNWILRIRFHLKELKLIKLLQIYI
jgi:AraC-like DNA-binding protein